MHWREFGKEYPDLSFCQEIRTEMFFPTGLQQVIRFPDGGEYHVAYDREYALDKIRYELRLINLVLKQSLLADLVKNYPGSTNIHEEEESSVRQ